MKLQPDAPGAVIHHLRHLALARAELFNDHPKKRLRAVDHQQLHRLMQLPVDRLGQNLRLADHQLIPLAAHHLDQNRQLQFSAAHHFKGVRAPGLFHFDRNVGQQFLIQAVARWRDVT